MPAGPEPDKQQTKKDAMENAEARLAYH